MPFAVPWMVADAFYATGCRRARAPWRVAAAHTIVARLRPERRRISGPTRFECVSNFWEQVLACTGVRQYGAVVGTERSCLKGGFTGFRNPGRGASYRTSNDQSGQTVAESRQSFGIARVSHQGISQECFRPQEPIYCAGVNFGYRP